VFTDATLAPAPFMLSKPDNMGKASAAMLGV
jgi:hypothetical protein